METYKSALDKMKAEEAAPRAELPDGDLLQKRSSTELAKAMVAVIPKSISSLGILPTTLPLCANVQEIDPETYYSLKAQVRSALETLETLLPKLKTVFEGMK